MALKKPTIRRVHWRGAYEWELNIEPTRREHYDGPNPNNSNIIGPWGETYHPTFEEAVSLLDDVVFLVRTGFLQYP